MTSRPSDDDMGGGGEVEEDQDNTSRSPKQLISDWETVSSDMSSSTATDSSGNRGLSSDPGTSERTAESAAGNGSVSSGRGFVHNGQRNGNFDVDGSTSSISTTASSISTTASSISTTALSISTTAPATATSPTAPSAGLAVHSFTPGTRDNQSEETSCGDKDKTSAISRISNSPNEHTSTAATPRPGASPPVTLADNVRSSSQTVNCGPRLIQDGGIASINSVSDAYLVRDAENGGDPNQGDTTETAEGSSLDTRIVWGASLTILTCYVISMMTMPTLSTQYLNFKIGKDRYNFSVDPDERHTDCHNSSSPNKDVLNRIQRDTSNVVLIASLASGIPSSLTCLVVGSYSDFLGRRPLVIASVVGALARVGSLAAVIYFDLSVQFFYLGSFVDGALGSYFTLALAVTAVIADITPVPEARALRFAVVEGTLFTAGALAQLAVGFMIKSWHYFAPAAIFTGSMAVALIVTVFCLPETMTRDAKESFQWNPTLHIRKVFGFYVRKTSDCRHALYLIGLGVFLFLILTNHGRSNVETLFVLNAPICWNPINIGIFQSLRLMLCSLTAVVVLKLLKYRLSLEATGMICGLSAAAGFAVESMATSGEEMYLSASVGILYLTAIPIPRAILSQITSPSEQGALFSSLAFVETAGSMFASLIYTLIYNGTLNTFKGAVFLLMGCLCLVNISLLAAFWWVRKNRPLQHLPDSETEVVVPTPSPTSSSPQSSSADGYSTPSSLQDNVERKFQQNASPPARKITADEKTPLLVP